LKDYIDTKLAAGSNGTETTILSGSIIWASGLTYNATNLTYKILGTSYSAMARQITLAPADATYPRIDLFYVDTLGNVNVATGTPATNPTSPILTTRQLEVMTVLVAAGATAPTGTTAEAIYDENNDATEWMCEAASDTYVGIDLASTVAPQSGTKSIKVSILVPDSAPEVPVHTIGETYQGGKIFWIDPTDSKKGLIAAAEDTASNVFWSRLSGYSDYGTGATAMEIGTGKANTDLMLANEAAAGEAASYCDTLIIGAYTDWYMPSQGELETMYFRRADIGNLGTKTYWSSTEDAWNKGRCVAFSNGTAYARLKNNAYSVRGIRAFNDADIENNVPVLTFAPSRTSLTFTRAEAVGATSGVLSFYLKTSLDWLPSTVLSIETWLGNEKTGSCSLSASNLMGYNPASSEWQLVAVPMAKFSPTGATLDRFVFALKGSWPNNMDLCIDLARYQHDVASSQGQQFPITGTYGSATKHVAITVDSSGRTTAIEEIIPAPVAVAGTYGGATKSAVVSVNAEGAITEVSEIDIDIGVKNSGARTTGVHAGTLNEMSVSDDYLYICVQAGGIGTAIWKKASLTRSE
jgi:hypothetical protein